VICAALWIDPADPLCPDGFREKAAGIMQKFWDPMGLQTRDFDDPLELRRALLDFIADFANWDNSTKKEYLDASRALTQAAHVALGGVPGTKPLVVDPFAGGGAIPLEALRVGADAFASDLNPVAVLLNKVVLEYIPRYGQQLADEVRKWGEWIKQEAEKELVEFYPIDADGSTPIGYLWARTIICEGPKCGQEMPIIKNQILSSRKGAEAAVTISYEKGKLRTNVVFGKDATLVKGGTSKRTSVTCPACRYTTPRKRVEFQANNRGFGFHMLAVVIRRPDGTRGYRQPTVQDHSLLNKADNVVAEWKLKEFGGISAIPKEELPYLRSIFNVRVYAIDQWHKLFHSRQLLSALVFTNTVRKAAKEIQTTYSDKTFAQAIIESVSLSVSNALQYQCNIATYLTEGIKSAFIQGQSLPMKMDFIEANPLMDTLAGGYMYSLSQHVSGLEYAASFQYVAGSVQQLSALQSVLPDGSVDLLATDPPYYDVVPYADCSDFFYVWLRRMLHDLTTFPSIDNLTPKDEEIVQLAERNERYQTRTKNWYEDKMRDSLSLARVAVRHGGGAVIIFAHKDTSAWEALLQSVLDGGWVITGSWPIDTEKSSRLRANESAVLTSSIHLFCRPRQNPDSIGEWSDVIHELPGRIHEWMPRLVEEDIVGADAIFSCLGPAMEIFSRYSSVEKASGEPVTLKEYMEYVWAAVTNEALDTIFAGADATGFEEDARLTAMWLWTLSASANGNGNGGTQADASASGKAPGAGGFALEYDAARKIAQGLGAHLENLPHLVEIKKGKARLLPVEERRQYLFGKDDILVPIGSKKEKTKQTALFGEPADAEEETDIRGDQKMHPAIGTTVLDRIHQAMLLFGEGRSDALKRFLVDDGAGQDDRFWRLAEPLHKLYPGGTSEKRWIEGVLARKKGLGL